MKDRKELNELIDKIINETDIKNISHYWFRDFEWMVYEDMKDKLASMNYTDLTGNDIDYIIHEVFMYSLKDLEESKFRFLMYNLKEYKNMLYDFLYNKYKDEWPKSE